MAHPEFEKLVQTMERLRRKDGCPWDQEQTHDSLRQYLLEETYEVLESIDNHDYNELKIELGDLLLQVIFHSQLAKEENRFNIDDVLKEINDKLIRRHPHVFGDKNIRTAAEQTVHWEKIKKDEGKKSAIDGVPIALSALLRAHRTQQKASTVGFDWETIEPVWGKVEEELKELKEACQAGHPQEISEEMGDLFFALVNLSRFINVNPEDALRATIVKFSNRFRQVENHFKAQDRELSDCSLEEMDAVWDQVKLKEIK